MSVVSLRRYVDQGYLRIYHKGTRGKYLLADEVDAFGEFRTDSRYNPEQLTHMASAAYYRATRAEKHLEALCHILGLSFARLSENREDVLQLYAELASVLETESACDYDMVVLGKLLQITEGYLTLVHRYTGDEHPWVLYLTAASRISDKYSIGSTHKAYAEATVRAIRSAAFMYVQDIKGPRIAKELFDEGDIASRVLHRIYPPLSPG